MKLICIWLQVGCLILITFQAPSQHWQTAYDSAATQLTLLRYHTAKPWAEKAHILAEGRVSKTDTNYARILNALAEADNYLGDYDNAFQYSQTALHVWEKAYGTRHLRYASTLQQVAESYQNLVKYPEAEIRHTEALQIIGQQVGEQSTTYAVALNRQALLYRTMGLQAKAIELTLKAKSIFEQTGDQESLAYALVLKNLGDLYTLYREEFIIPNVNTAITSLTKTLTLIEQKSGRQNPVYAEVLRTLVSAYNNRRYYLKEPMPDIEPVLNEALTILAQTVGTKSIQYSSCAEDLSDFYRRQGQFAKARLLSEEILAFSDSLNGPKHPNYTMALFGLYRVYGQMGLHQQIEPLLRQCNQNLIREMRLFSTALNDEEREQLVANTANGFIWLHSYARAIAQHNPAITTEQYDTQLAIKGFLLRADQKFRQQLTRSPDTALRRLYTDWQHSRESLARASHLNRAELARRGIRLDSLETQTHNLEKLLAIRAPQTADALLAGNHTWRDVQAKLQPGEAAIELVRYRVYRVLGFPWGRTDTVHYVALIITPDCAYPRAVILENGNDLEGPLLAAYRNDILNQTNAANSYQHYWRPISSALRGVRRLYLSLDGVYNQINVGTLRNPGTGRFALDEREIVLVTTTSDLLRSQPKKKAVQPMAVLIGYPDYGRIVEPFVANRGLSRQSPVRRASQTRLSRDGFYEPLPATKQEVTEIGLLLRSRFKVQNYTASDAREEVVKTIESPAVLHIATHGFFETDTALGHALQSPLFRSGLVLAGANRALQDTTVSDLFSPSHGEDGILTAYEAMNLNLGQTELVVLSACQTGLGEVRNGEGVYGLQRAFKVAGAKSLLMSLWKVDDDVTRQLMTTFYRNWLQIGDKVRAFRLAQQTLRKKYPHPFYWGAFVLVGW